MGIENIKLLEKTPEKGLDVIEFFEKLSEDFSIPVDIKFYYVVNNKQKTLVKISKIPDQYAIGLKSDIIVSFNEVYFDNLDDESKIILISQEIDKLEFNSETGTLKMGKATIETSKGIIKKYSYDEVERAIELQREFEKQLKDKEKDKKENKKKKNNY
jgi:hypothetical protein